MPTAPFPHSSFFKPPALPHVHGQATLSSIAALNPHTISWSNVSDYYAPRDFHKMARACSGGNTIHYGYSMNWPLHVKGASIIDHVLPAKYNGIEDISYLDDMLPKAKDAAGMATKLHGLEKLILVPPVDDTRNIFDYSFFVAYYKSWLKAFFSVAGMKDWTRQTILTDLPTYSVLNRTNSTVYFTFTYDPEITFRFPEANA